MRAGVGLAVAEGLHLTVVCVRVCAGGYAQERERARARERERVCVCVRERERERDLLIFFIFGPPRSHSYYQHLYSTFQ